MKHLLKLLDLTKEEITEKVFEAYADEIFEQAKNRLHVQKAVMVKLIKDQ